MLNKLSSENKFFYTKIKNGLRFKTVFSSLTKNKILKKTLILKQWRCQKIFYQLYFDPDPDGSFKLVSLFFSLSLPCGGN